MNSSQLNELSESQLRAIGNNLKATTSANIRGKEAVAISTAGAATLDQYWEDGPALTGWGTVVAKYPDGAPAIVEGASGNGWVLLSAVHPEAPASWRGGMTFTRLRGSVSTSSRADIV